MDTPESYRRAVGEALDVLGVENLVLSIHDVSFPADGSDVGRGSPYSVGGRAFLAFARSLGFNGIQLGPQGELAETNPSPYDSTVFSRTALNIPLSWLVDVGLLTPETAGQLIAGRPPGDRRADHRYAFSAHQRALREAHVRFRTLPERHADLARPLAEFRRANAAWLEPVELYNALCREHDRPYFREWPAEGQGAIDQRLYGLPPEQEEAGAARRAAVLRAHEEPSEQHAFAQLLVHEQHKSLRELARSLRLALFGDLQIGYAPQDAWAYQSLFLRDYRMGAPPSRTNPEGQAWGYPVLDPAQYRNADGSPGAVLQHVRARVGKLLDEFDGFRVDHPHGLVCPWVYRDGPDDPLVRVRAGARLFDSPALPDHPELARFAIARPEQLTPGAARHADEWVSSLTGEQVERYATVVDAVMASARERGRKTERILCEVLSTMPYPLKRVIERHGLGRFRVTQKANLDNPADVYRTENAQPADWVMLGNHDTPPIWRVVDRWSSEGALEKHAAHLAQVLGRGGDEAFRQSLAREPNLLVQAKLAELFASRARNVMVFFADLLGLREVYNAPGTISDDNWSLRVPRDYASDYRGKLQTNAALNLPFALALALRARGVSEDAPLVKALEAVR